MQEEFDGSVALVMGKLLEEGSAESLTLHAGLESGLKEVKASRQGEAEAQASQGKRKGGLPPLAKLTAAVVACAAYHAPEVVGRLPEQAGYTAAVDGQVRYAEAVAQVLVAGPGICPALAADLRRAICDHRQGAQGGAAATGRVEAAARRRRSAVDSLRARLYEARASLQGKGVSLTRPRRRPASPPAAPPGEG